MTGPRLGIICHEPAGRFPLEHDLILSWNVAEMEANLLL